MPIPSRPTDFVCGQPMPSDQAERMKRKWACKAAGAEHCASIDKDHQRRCEYFASLGDIPKGEWPFPRPPRSTP